jgi:hypothetical protein
MTIEHSLRGANPLGGEAQRGEQQQLFSLPQTEYTSDDFWTPKWIFDAMGVEFDLDVACPPGGPKHTPTKNYYTQQDDGLSSPWYGRVFMNPPFSKATPWMVKFLDHGNGIGIGVASKSRWFGRLWNEIDGLVFLPSDLKYDAPNGGEHGIFMPSMIFACGKDNVEAIAKLGRVR